MIDNDDLTDKNVAEFFRLSARLCELVDKVCIGSVFSGTASPVEKDTSKMYFQDPAWEYFIEVNKDPILRQITIRREE
jgi:hypothetical protein